MPKRWRATRPPISRWRASAISCRSIGVRSASVAATLSQRNGFFRAASRQCARRARLSDFGSSAGTRGDSAMARTYRDVAIEQMLETVEEAMSQVTDWWGDLPPPMAEAIAQFRSELGAAIDAVEFVKRALDREMHDMERGKDTA